MRQNFNQKKGKRTFRIESADYSERYRNQAKNQSINNCINYCISIFGNWLFGLSATTTKK
jgi:uncharacterized membrane protein